MTPDNTCANCGEDRDDHWYSMKLDVVFCLKPENIAQEFIPKEAREPSDKECANCGHWESWHDNGEECYVKKGSRPKVGERIDCECNEFKHSDMKEDIMNGKYGGTLIPSKEELFKPSDNKGCTHHWVDGIDHEFCFKCATGRTKKEAPLLYIRCNKCNTPTTCPKCSHKESK